MDKGFESLRIRKLTEKAAVEFEATNDGFVTDLRRKWTTIKNVISSFSSSITTVEYIENIEKDISKLYAELCSTSSSYMLFLTNIRTEDSIRLYHEHLEAMSKCKKTVEETIKHIDDARQRALEVASQRTKGSSRHSQVSNASSALSRKRAKAEAAKAKLVFAEQEIILKKEQAALEEQEMTIKAASSRKMLELEADLKLLASRQDLAVAEAEAEVYESGSVINGPSLRTLEKLDQLKLINPIERTNQYVKDQINFINADNQPMSKPTAPLNVNAQTFSPVAQDNNIQISNQPFQNLKFMRDMTKMKNDPGFSYPNESSSTPTTVKEKAKFPRNNHSRPQIAVNKTEVKSERNQVSKTCPLHNTNHSLNNCRGFKEKSFEDRKKFLREHNICFKCCNSDQHKSKDCKEKVPCEACGSESHASAMHLGFTEHKSRVNHGEEKNIPEQDAVTKCTQICKQQFSGKSCAKIVQVKNSQIRLAKQNTNILCDFRRSKQQDLGELQYSGYFEYNL
ncbi:Hypothetical predicted protein [Mytilus galloprovincialis]|uniref:Uncharacterized protein n=1 Tax=Mytilus galloprovincialis TaxID=29158 RepID=A0A8B6CIE5_MYTGA|nr:Hypothetical predicted protein [Mytilus galloprovincialis]